MDEKNQILDVTYGNFSCRLEGFEDSVETMKTVVSFFHDLAGHERFMDVDPLAPDMDTLARLTEEQTGQPVEVDGEGNQVSLRVRQDAIEDDASEDAVESEMLEADEAVEEELAEEELTTADVDDIDDAEAEDDSFDLDSSVADKLQRIRAVVDRGPETEEEDFAEDLSESVPAVPPANPLSQRLAELAKRNSELVAEDEAEAEEEISEMPAEDAAEDFSDDVNDDATAAFAAEIDEQSTEEAEVEAAEVEEDNVFAASLNALNDDEELLPSEDDMAAEASDDEIMPAELSEDDDDDEFEASEEALEDEEALEEAAMEAAEDDEDDASDLEPLVLTSRDVAFADDEPDMAHDDESEDDYDSDDDDDDDFDLREEVAKVEAEIAARHGNELARHGLPRSVEDAMSRIMSQTDQHLNQPESRRHRDAFAQLKAAVAATEAARQLGDKGAETRDPDEVFKDDLGVHEAEERKGERSTPPLKLVKSQEVKPEDEEPTSDMAEEESYEEPAAEAPAPVTAKPVDAASERLRQIAAKKEAEQADSSSGFAEFAAAHGATDLVERLEAAGAYICFVEGEDDFSRPQVMKVVQSASKEEITREDGLRCFGRLLRQARLVKLANGRFQVAENTQYRPNGDKAAQG